MMQSRAGKPQEARFGTSDSQAVQTPPQQDEFRPQTPEMAPPAVQAGGGWLGQIRERLNGLLDRLHESLSRARSNAE